MRKTVGSESRSGDLTVESDLIVGSTNVIDELALKAPLASPTFTGTVEAADIEVSGGVFLGGTAAANELNDYEEGTWTPTYTNVTVGNGTVTATYTKVGRIVSVTFYLVWGSTTSFSGQVTIAGLPFSGAALAFQGVWCLDSGNTNYQLSGRQSGTAIILNTIGANGIIGSVNATSPFTWTTNDAIAFNIAYQTN